MKDNGGMMAEPPPAPFTLEREVTLLPAEFRERLSASTRSRKSSGARTGTGRRKGLGTGHSGSLAPADNLNTLNAFSEELDNGVDLAYTDTQTHYNICPENSLDRDSNGNSEDKEGNAIELDEEVKFMLNNAYTNYESENNYSIRTPPSNMHIGDLILPLEDWSSKDKETIRERKYAVLPSIGSPSSDLSTSHTPSSKLSASTMSFNNQLDFGRERMEQEADFFADFRVNTSRVKATPRNDPLPPIPHTPGVTPRVDYVEHQKRSSYKKRGRSKERQKMILN